LKKRTSGEKVTRRHFRGLGNSVLHLKIHIYTLSKKNFLSRIILTICSKLRQGVIRAVERKISAGG
jgi:hypothetical protein